MTKFRKFALFQLAVAGLAAVAVISLFAWSGNVLASMAGFATLALLGLRAALLQGSGTRPVQDERDEAIQHRATVAGYVALWLALVIWGTAMPLVFGDRGTVPLVWVAPVVWVAWWLVTCVQSITILILDSRGA
jgi:cytochrome b561